MARTQKNKATSFHLGSLAAVFLGFSALMKVTGQLKAKLAKLKRELLEPSSGGGGGGGASLLGDTC